MLRKAGHISIIFLLLIATSGVTITRHYCGNTLVTKSILTTPDDCCKGPCKACRNETKFVKLTDIFEFTELKIHFSAEVKILTDHLNLFTAVLLPGFGLTYQKQFILPIKDPFEFRRPAEDAEAILQCFRL